MAKHTATVVGGPMDGQEVEVRGAMFECDVSVARKPMSFKESDPIGYDDGHGGFVFPQRILRRSYYYAWDIEPCTKEGFDADAMKFKAVLKSWKDSEFCKKYAAPGEWIWEDGFGPNKDKWLGEKKDG